MVEISIIVPVYNAEKYIERCISSIVDQTFESFELILVNDGSKDKSGSICDLYALKDKRIRVVHKPNGGVSSARNKGIEIAQGKYIMFCDSDDYVQPCWCEHLHGLIVNKEVSLAFCGYKSVNIKSGDIVGSQKYADDVDCILPRNVFWNIYMKNLLNMPWNKIYRAEIIKKNKIKFDENWAYNEDLLFVLNYIQSSNGCFGISNALLYNYSQGIDGSLTNRYVSNLWEIKKHIFKEIDSTLDICGITLHAIKNEYYSKWIWAIESAIANEMRIENNVSGYKKFKNIFEITRSVICKNAFEMGTFEKTATTLYKKVLKTRSAILIMLYFDLNRLKSKIKKQGIIR